MALLNSSVVWPAPSLTVPSLPPPPIFSFLAAVLSIDCSASLVCGRDVCGSSNFSCVTLSLSSCAFSASFSLVSSVSAIAGEVVSFGGSPAGLRGSETATCETPTFGESPFSLLSPLPLPRPLPLTPPPLPLPLPLPADAPPLIESYDDFGGDSDDETTKRLSAVREKVRDWKLRDKSSTGSAS